MQEKAEQFNEPETTNVSSEYLYKLEEQFLYYKKAFELIEDELTNDPTLALEQIEEIIREVKELL